MKNVAFGLCLDFHPFFHSTKGSLLLTPPRRPAQNSPRSQLLLLICLPIQLLLQVTYLTQKIHFFRQLRTQRTIEQQISVIVNFETNLTFNLFAPTRDLEQICWPMQEPTIYGSTKEVYTASQNWIFCPSVHSIYPDQIGG